MGIWGAGEGHPGFSGDASGKEPACQPRRRKRLGFDPWVGEIPGSGRSLGREDPLEESTAIHPSILPWGIPGTEEPGRLRSTGSQSWTRLK